MFSSPFHLPIISGFCPINHFFSGLWDHISCLFMLLIIFRWMLDIMYFMLSSVCIFVVFLYGVAIFVLAGI